MDAARAPGSAAVLLMHRVQPSAVPWLLSRLVRGPSLLQAVDGLRFAKVLGSGRRGGFGLRPGWDCQGVFAVFDSLEQAHDFAFISDTAQAYAQRAVEGFGAVLQVCSARGAWSGERLLATARAPAPGLPVAALTRASIRPAHAAAFWRHSPPSELALERAPGCQLAVGLGEAPVLRQATFSLWDSQAAMDAYARHGPHHAAIAASVRGGWFSESLFARFVPVRVRGNWQGRVLDLRAPWAPVDAMVHA